MMTQAQAISGLSIDTSFATGQLSLHEYRKFLSRQDNIKMSAGNPQRTLKRKQAAFNLSQAQAQAQAHTQYHDFTYNLQSPVSSAPSSPPPLSFSQSLVSLHGDLPTPISPISTSASRPFSRPVSSNNSSVTRRLDPFSARLKKPKQYSRTHSRTSSDLTLPSTGGSLTLKINHNGTDFDILNPRDSLFHYQGLSSYWSSEDIMEREDSPERISQSQSFMTPNSNPDDMVRPISASESAILSRRKKLPSPSPTTSGMLGASNSFAALPPVEEVPWPSTRAGTRSPKIPGRTLRQKVSRLFGGSAEVANSEKRASYHSPKLDTEAGCYDMKHPETYHDEEMYTPSSEQWPEELTSMLPIHIGEQPDTRHASTQNSSQRNSEEEENLKTIRRPTWGTHSTNRHHTLQDALQQLETENHGLTYDDIMRYIGTNSDSGHDQAASLDNAHGHDEKGARPWQPDTWQEPTRHRMPHNRPSDSNLSTNAPSTRPSIRPYVERAAAFMAGDDRSSVSSSTSTTESNGHNRKDEHASNADQVVDISPASPDVKATTTSEPSTPPLTLRRTISLRARPLSSNPPDLDTPIIPASPPKTAEATLRSPAATTIPITPTTPTTPAPPRAGSRISWGPEIPQRHPDHRMLQFAGSPSSINSPKDGKPQPQSQSQPRVVTTTTGPRKLRKKHASGCHCL